MPGNVKAAAPVGVMPQALMSAFTVELRLESLVNQYPDASSDRAALASGARSFFKLTCPLNSNAWINMLDFYKSHIGLPFFFYFLRETIPPWTADPSGSSTFGRYTVVFDGPWVENLGLPRASISFNLREVV